MDAAAARCVDRRSALPHHRAIPARPLATRHVHGDPPGSGCHKTPCTLYEGVQHERTRADPEHGAPARPDLCGRSPPAARHRTARARYLRVRAGRRAGLAPRAAYRLARQARGAVRRQAPDHRLRAQQLHQLRRAAHRGGDAVQGAQPDPASAARLELPRRAPAGVPRRAARPAACARGLVRRHRRRGLPEPRHPADAVAAARARARRRYRRRNGQGEGHALVRRDPHEQDRHTLPLPRGELRWMEPDGLEPITWLV